MYMYKTITLRLLEDYPRLYEQLRQNRLVLPTLDFLASQLSTGHEAWKEHLGRTRPHSDPAQIASDALELALNDLENSLLTALPPNEDETLPLDQAMAFVRHHTPAA